MEIFEIGGTFAGTRPQRPTLRGSSRPILYSNLQPTAGFEPATRCLQIRRQLNSARNFRSPCIPRMSIESKRRRPPPGLVQPFGLEPSPTTSQPDEEHSGL